VLIEKIKKYPEGWLERRNGHGRDGEGIEEGD